MSKTLSCAVAGFAVRISSFLLISSFGFENCSLFNRKAGQRTGESGRSEKSQSNAAIFFSQDAVRWQNSILREQAHRDRPLLDDGSLDPALLRFPCPGPIRRGRYLVQAGL